MTIAVTCVLNNTMTNTHRLNWIPNEGNFQEYPYETEWLECNWKYVHQTLNLVTAFYYPWIKIDYEALSMN